MLGLGWDGTLCWAQRLLSRTWVPCHWGLMFSPYQLSHWHLCLAPSPQFLPYPGQASGIVSQVQQGRATRASSPSPRSLPPCWCCSLNFTLAHREHACDGGACLTVQLNPLQHHAAIWGEMCSAPPPFPPQCKPSAFLKMQLLWAFGWFSAPSGAGRDRSSACLQDASPARPSFPPCAGFLHTLILKAHPLLCPPGHPPQLQSLELEKLYFLPY